MHETPCQDHVLHRRRICKTQRQHENKLFDIEITLSKGGWLEEDEKGIGDQAVIQSDVDHDVGKHTCQRTMMHLKLT